MPRLDIASSKMKTEPDHNMASMTGSIKVMGILNVTPDSFSDGGKFAASKDVVDQALKMESEGADIIDIGGESTRPGAKPVSPEEEEARVLPAIKAIRRHSDIAISVDTTKSELARKALDTGANIINDISALRFDTKMPELVKETGAPVIIMHMQGTPGNMQKDPSYDDVVSDIYAFLEERVNWVVEQGIDRKKIVVDPGIGFGKTLAHNLALINQLERFSDLGCPLLIGHSRKAFIGVTLDREVDDRDTATAIISAICVMKGANILRVHDVDKTVQAVKLFKAITGSEN